MARSVLARGVANTALALASIAVALIIVECGLRLFFYGSLAQPDYGQAFHRPHQTLGWALRPDTAASKQELDYKVPVTINSLGVRGPEIGYARTPGVFRILVLSDSAIFGSGVDDAHTVPVMLAELLSPLPVEVVNLSVAAYSTTQEYILFMEEGRKYRPDLVLLGVSPGNDIQTTYLPLQRLFQNSQRRPFASLDADGALVIDYHHAGEEAERRAEDDPGVLARFFRNTVLLRAARAAASKLGGAGSVDPNVFLGWPYLATFDESYAIDGHTAADYEQLWGEAWRVFQVLVRKIQAESHAVGAEFAIFVSPSKLQGDPAYRARVADTFPGVVLDVGKFEEEMARFAHEIDAPFLPVLPAMLAAAAESRQPLFYDLEDEHWTVAGNRVVAQALAEGLRDRGLLPGGAAGIQSRALAAGVD